MRIEEFLNESLTPFNTKTALEKLFKDEKEKYIEIKVGEEWNIKEDKIYLVNKDNGGFILFKVSNKTKAFKIIGSHIDSPCLKIKGPILIDSPEGKRINVEAYGGLINYSMLDIPLRIAGRVFISRKDQIEEVEVKSEKYINIPSQCIHHNIEVNKNLSLSVQNDLLPLLGECDDLYKFLGIKDKVISQDLYVVPAEKPFYTSEKDELLVSPRLDNLVNAYASIKALINSDVDGIGVVCLFNNEETGSCTRYGALSDFLRSVLKGINKGLKRDKQDFYASLENGLFVSADNGHACHQAHPEKSDPVNKCIMNKGIIIKHHTNYATDGISSGIVKLILERNKISYQDYYNNSDIRCGSTIGPLVSTNLQMKACDIGLAQLAMHSAIETVGAKDIKSMEKFMECFLNSKILIEGNIVKIK